MKNSVRIAQQAKVVKLYLQALINKISFNYKDNYELATAYRETKSQWCNLERMVEDTGILDIESEEQ